MLLLAVAMIGLIHHKTVQAQGFGIYEHGTCAMGRAGATVAADCDDASGIFYNPAGLSGKTGFRFTAGATVIGAFGEFTSNTGGRTTELQNDPIPVPHAYLSYGLDEKLAFGLGFYVPYGLGTVWPENFEGRFLSYDSGLESFYIQPTVAYRFLDNVSVGAGLTYVIGSVELNQRADLSRQIVPGAGVPFSQVGVPVGTDFADVNLEAGGATGIGGNFGLQVDLTRQFSIGARYMTPVKLEYEGDATFRQISTGIVLPGAQPVPVDVVLAAQFAPGQALSAQTATTEITMPGQMAVGIAFRATPDLLLLADYQRVFWSVFDEIVLDFQYAPTTTQVENYNDTNGIRVGAEYTLSPALTLRAGALAHSAAAPDETVTPLLPEAARREFTLGAGWKIVPAAELNVAYQYLGQSDREGRTHEGPNNGTYSFGAHIFAGSLTVRL